jgi:predicted DNA-binding transcriptional regulator YafY
MDYFSYHSDTHTKREVEPIGIIFMSSNWYLIAWCRLRHGYRNFRMDRIKHLLVTTESYDKTRHITLKEYTEKYAEKDSNAYLIKIRFPAVLGRRIGEQKYYYGLIEEQITGEYVEMTFLFPSLQWFGRWLLLWGNRVEIITPTELVAQMKTFALEIKEHYL